MELGRSFTFPSDRMITYPRMAECCWASKKKGMWMGGLPPLGYDVQDKKLVVSPDEAETVRTLFRLYLKLGTVKKASSPRFDASCVSRRDPVTLAARRLLGRPRRRDYPRDG